MEEVRGKYVCICNRSFDNLQSYRGHLSHCKEHQIKKHGNLHKLIDSEHDRHLGCSKTRERKRLIKQLQQLILQKQQDLVWASQQNTCERCGKIMTEKFGSGRFCSRSCANSRQHSEETKHKLSIAAKNNESWKNLLDDSGQFLFTKINRSKGEIKLLEQLKNLMPDSDWTFGKIGEYMGVTLTPDMFSRKLKCVIEYDGIWHFKDIHGQLSRKQDYDRKMIQYCSSIQYKIIRIDEQYTYDIKNIVDLILNDDRKMILLGDRYQYLCEDDSPSSPPLLPNI